MSPATSSCSVECDPLAPRHARDWARTMLASASDRSRVSPQLVDDTVLCISELVTNALQAACSHITLDVSIDRVRVRVVVTDDGDGWPVACDPGPAEPHGRGLMIVDQLADRWGAESSGSAKAVWAELASSR